MPDSPSILRRLFRRKKETLEEPAGEPEISADEAAVAKARAYLEEVRQKMERLADDFAAGRVNLIQFQELYAHYRQERKAVEKALEETPEAAAWRAAAATGDSAIIRRRHAARILGYAIYLNASGAPIRTVGEHHVDGRLLASMLDSFRSDTEEPLERQIRSIEIEHARWVGFVPGRYTTLVVLFSVEPARAQLDMLRDLQAHFERANQYQFIRGVTDPTQLVFPHAVMFE